VSDISERVKAERALHESEQQYRNIIDNMQDCLYRTDAEGYLVFASPSIQALMACDEGEIIGDKLSDYYVQPDAGERLIQQLSDSADGKVEGFEIQVQPDIPHLLFPLFLFKKTL